MKRIVLLTISQLVLLLMIPALTTQASANEIVDTYLRIQSLTITPDRGSVVIPTSGGFSHAGLINGYQNVGGPCPQTVLGASADCSLDPNLLTGFVSMHIDVPTGVWAYGGSEIQFYTTKFAISETTGPVSVQFHTLVDYSVYQQTDLGYDSSLTVFSLGAGNNSIFFKAIGYDLGRGSSVFSSGTWDLNNSITVNAGQDYSFLLWVRTDAAANPEPSTVLLVLGGLSPIVFSRLRAMRRH